MLDRKIPVHASMDVDLRPSRNSRPRKWMDEVAVLAGRHQLLENTLLSNRMTARRELDTPDMFPGVH